MKKIIVFMICIAVLFVVAACARVQPEQPAPAQPAPAQPAPAQPAPAQPAEEIVIKFGHVLAPTHPYQIGAEKFKELLEANAPQPVRVEIFHSAQIGNEREMIEGLQLGTIEMAIAPGPLVGFEPMMGVLDLPFIFRDREHAHRVLDGEIGAELAKNLPNVGLRLLAYWENGFRQITNNIRPIYTPADLDGVRLRLPENRIYVAHFNQQGASVVTIPFGEVFTALQQGVIDGQENSLAIAVTNKLYEVQEYLSLTNHVYGPAQVLISEIFWQKLSPEMQEAVREAAEEARDFQRQALADKEQEYLEELKRNGMVVNEADVEAFRNNVGPVWDAHRAEFEGLLERILETE